jgi:predicted MFS family arabinose efflux permease
VAAQGAAWLLVSLPAGVLVDRASRSRLLALSQGLAAAAFLGAAFAAGAGSAGALGAASFAGASGAVILVLALLAAVPQVAGRERLASANARIELVRATAALTAPVIVGLLAERVAPAAGFALAALSAAAAAAMAMRLRIPDAPPVARPPVLAAIREGAAFALGHPLLRGIVLCAVFWNLAFFALLAVAVPFCLDRVGLTPRTTGLAQGAYGVGLILGAALAGRIMARVEPRFVLVLGPAASVAAALLMLLAGRGGGLPAAAGAFFLLGFGPMLWLVCQTSIRQLVTPAPLLGRVAATVQVAIYGVRPLGALSGGWTGAALGLEAALGLVLAGFGLSLAVPLVSALGRLRALPAPAGA